MNVLLGTPWPLGYRGGVSVVVRTLGEHFSRLGDQVVILQPTHGQRPVRRDEGGLVVYEVPMRRPFIAKNPLRSRLAFALMFPFTCWWLAGILRRHSIQTVNLHYFGDYWIYLLWLQPLLRFRLAISVHGSDVLGAEREQNLRLLHRYSARIAAIICCSRGFLEEALASEPELYRRGKVILNAIGPVASEVGSEPVLEGGYIACVAHLRQHKAQDVLIRAFALLQHKYPALHLRLAGDGPFRAELQELANRLGAAPRVHFHGDIPRSAALRLIQQAQIMCLPSRREPFGLVLLEAMALGTPVVATRTGGVPEVIRDGVDGLLVPTDSVEALATALDSLLHDPELRNRLRQEGLSRVRTYFAVERFVQEYRQALSPAAGAQAAGA